MSQYDKLMVGIESQLKISKAFDQLSDEALEYARDYLVTKLDESLSDSYFFMTEMFEVDGDNSKFADEACEQLQRSIVPQLIRALLSAAHNGEEDKFLYDD